MKKLLLLVPVLLVIIGCGKPPAPKDAVFVQKDMPSWYTNPAQNSATYLYGIGSGSNQEEATNAALSNMISKLGTTIESTFESNTEITTTFTESINKKVKQNIKSSIAKINISNYEVVDTEKMSYDNTLVFIKTDKKKFAQHLNDEIDMKISKIKTKKSMLSRKNALERYNTLFDLNIESTSLISNIMVLSEVDKSLNKKSYLNFISKTNSDFEDARKNLKFFVYGDKKSKQFVTKLKNYLSSKSLKLTNKKSSKSINISLKTSSRVTKSMGMKIAIFSINTKVYANKEDIGGKVIIKKERMSGDFATAYKNASVHFEQDLQDLSTEEAIGIKIKGISKAL